MNAAVTDRIAVEPADAAWLRMDRPSNRMSIVAVLEYEGRMTVPRMRTLVAERLLRFERFRRRVIEDGGRLYWETDPGFDVDRHVTAAELPGTRGPRELQDLVGRVMSEPLQPDRPPWEFVVVESFGAGSAVVARLHHGIADGIALIRVLLGMADDPSGPESSRRPPVARPRPAVGATRRAAGIVTALAKFALVGADSPTRFRGSLSTEKRVAWSDPLPLDDVKRVARAFGVTVNDILLAALAGGLRRFLETDGPVPPDTELRTVVPVNLRPADEPVRMGNRFGLVLAALPVGIRECHARVAEIARRMDDIKRSMEPVVALGILRIIGRAPQALQNAVVRRLAASSSAVMTNVPGPPERLEMDGVPLSRVMFWVPRAGSIGLGISILSYAGEVVLGFAVDASLVEDPHALVDAFRMEWTDLAESDQ